MTGSTNQVQTPFSSSVRSIVSLAAGAAGGVSTLPANPGISYTGTLYGSLFTVWQGSTIGANGYSTPLVVANYDNAQANGVSQVINTLTTLDLGGIQVINNAFSGNTAFTLTSLTANSLIQMNSDFSLNPGATLTSLTMPLLKYIGGSCGLLMNGLSTLSLPSLVAVNGNFTPSPGTATSINFSSLQYIGGSFNPAFFALVSMSFAALQYIGSSMLLSGMPSLTTASFPAIVTINGAIQSTITVLTNFSLGSTLKTVNGNCTMTGNALNQASIDGVLVSLAALDGTGGTTAYSSRTVALTGGTNATPSATGLAAKGILQGRGCTVTNN